VYYPFFFRIFAKSMKRNNEKRKAVLVLEDGAVFYGNAAGAVGTTTGEIAFNTGLTGYQEIFTDPSYFGQILVMTPSHIGNYGAELEEVESEGVKISGLVVKKFSEIYSRPRANESLQAMLDRNSLVGISDVDTRAVVRHIRNKGAMNAIISSDNLDVDALKTELAKVPSMAGLELSSKVCTKEPFEVGNGDLKVALMDFGVKKNIIRCLADRGCTVKVFPMDTKKEEVLDWKPNGIMLSNGPGDPSAMPETIDLVKSIVETKLPVFGICLGHQLLALSQGLSTEKMFNGHRGINHPIKNLETGKCEVTSQNHGFVVSRESLDANANVEETHVHLNDNTVAGIRLKDQAVFSVQYHPESSPGPHDSRYLFDTFIDNMKNN